MVTTKNQKLLNDIELMEQQTEQLLNELFGISIPTLSGAKGHFDGMRLRREAWANWRLIKNTYKLKDDIPSIIKWIDTVPQLSSLSHDQISDAIRNTIEQSSPSPSKWFKNSKPKTKTKYSEDDIGELFSNLAMKVKSNQNIKQRSGIPYTDNNPTTPPSGGGVPNIADNNNTNNNKSTVSSIDVASRLARYQKTALHAFTQDLTTGVKDDPELLKKLLHKSAIMTRHNSRIPIEDIEVEQYKIMIKHLADDNNMTIDQVNKEIKDRYEPKIVDNGKLKGTGRSWGGL